MGKKKAIKLATATAIAASAFVAVAPTQSEAATSSVDKAITKASSAMLKAFNTYNKTARVEGKLPALSTIKKDVKSAQDAYTAAAKEIASKGGTKAQKATLTKKLDTNKKYLDRAELYLKAVTTNLKPTKEAFTAAVAGGTQSKVLSAQKAYQAKIKEFEANVKKVYGPDARELLTAKYADAANELVNSVNDEMTVYQAYKKISVLVDKEDLEAAEKLIVDTKETAAKVAKLDTKLAKNITNAVVKINKKFEDAQVPAVKEVSAINTKTVQVTFSTPVKDTSKAQFEVKKGASTIGVSATKWSEDKKSATLEINSKLTEGTYNISVKGLSEEALNGSVTVENEKVAEIKILSDSLIKSGEKTGAVGYQVLNQYGEDVTSTSLANLAVSSPNGELKAEKGKLSLESSSVLKAGDKVVVTVIDKNTAKTANATLTVASEAKVSEVAVNGIYNKDSKTLSEDTKSDNFYVLVDVKDQYGNEITDVNKLKNELTVLASNTTVADFSKDKDGKAIFEEIEVNKVKKLALKVVPGTKGDSLVTLISNSTGKSVSQLVTVAEGVKVDTVTIGSPEGVIAGSEKVLVPVEITNNKGAAVTKVADTTGVKVTLAGATSKEGKIVEKDGKLYIELTTDSVKANEVGNLIVSVTTPTNKFSNKVFQVKTDAVAQTLVNLDSKVSTSIYQNQKITLEDKNFIVQDQYGRTITDGFTVDVESADDAKIKVEKKSGIISITALKDSALVTFTINKGKTNESSVDVRFTTVAQSEFASYKVTDAGTLLATDDVDYAKDLEVYGVTKDGKEVKLPKDEYNVVVGNGGFKYNSDTNKLSGDKSQVETNSKNGLPETKDATAKVIINDTGDELSVKGKISAVAPKAAKVEYVENEKTVDSAELTITTGTLTAGNLTNIAVTDQYGVEGTVATSEKGNLVITFADDSHKDALVTFSSVVNVDKTEAKIESNGTETAKVSNLKDGATLTAKVSVNGVTTTVKFKINLDAVKAPAEEVKDPAEEA
ncbi:hypothetical protein ACQKL6_00920 [Peribacillus sp. NPDC097197]|uniref:hypothetical protein n=1 Tax=Peribacillus sp. NPDC097197 TaxID=3390615 RepID=UPI003CFEA43D